MSTSCKLRLAVDIGGTFTDVAVEAGGAYLTSKILTTADNPVEGVLRAAELALEQAGISAGDIGGVIHGTTLATNALIERRGATVGIIVTEGFRDILEIAYERRYDQYDLYLEKPDMMVPRHRTRTVTERVTANGHVLVTLDQKSAARAIDDLLAKGVDSFAICLLHSYKNPLHEVAIRELIEKRAPAIPVTLSSEVSPELREYDRLCTTMTNAYIKPLMAGYLSNLESGLEKQGFDCPLFMMTSGGGMTTLRTAMAFPVRLVESGPSGGAILAANVALARDCAQVLSFDMGGTTAKVCLIEEGQPRTSRAFEVARAERFIKASGLPVRIPVLEMIEIGAGGGSIASVDALNRLTVGPTSASSDPGPACYGLGGTLPTVTDSDALVGYLDPDAFAEGRLTLNVDLATTAIEREISSKLETGAAAGADGISQIVDEAMANAARMHAVEQGKSLEDCVMVAFGGNGPLHATRVAEKVGIREIVIPPEPGAGSAVGFLSAPVSYEVVRSHYMQVHSFDAVALNKMLEDMQTEAEAIVRAGAGDQPLNISRHAFMRYRGQGHEIEVEMPPGRIDENRIQALIDGFETTYARVFGRSVPGMTIEIMNWSVRVADTPEPPSPARDYPTTNTPQRSGERALRHGQQGNELCTPCFRRQDLTLGDHIVGPALIVEPQTTTFVSASFEARIDDASNIVMRRRAREDAASTDTDALSALDFQVMWNRLQAVVEEQAQVLIRAAFSPIVRECGDISAGIFAVDGKMLAQAVTGTPGHINTMAAAVALMLDHMPLEALNPGDVFVTNDPWMASGHLNDVLLVAPVFDANKLIGFTACTSHLYDLGGLGMGPDGSDVHDEGLFIPPLKVVDRGQVSPMFLAFLKANSRAPESNEGDLYALIACCDTGAKRVVEMMGEFGLPDLEALGDHILGASNRAAKAAIAQVPNGTYYNEMMLDGYDFEIALSATMTVTDDEIATDFLGLVFPLRDLASTCRSTTRPRTACLASVAWSVRRIPNNAGSLAPFKITAPEGCIVNALFPAPVAMRHCIGQLMPDLVLGCLHQALPGQIPAEGASCMWDIPIRSVAMSELDDNAATFAMDLTHNGGTGARPDSDGLSATAYPSGVWGSQVEITESVIPVHVLRRELIADSGGAGSHRGGLGQIIELESSEQRPIVLFRLGRAKRSTRRVAVAAALTAGAGVSRWVQARCWRAKASREFPKVTCWCLKPRAAPATAARWKGTASVCATTFWRDW